MARELYKGDERKHLHGTVCLYKGEPVFVQAEKGDGLITLMNLGDLEQGIGKSVVIDYTDPEFSYKSPPLGYMNHLKRAQYLVRVPIRMNKQGLTADAIDTIPPGRPRGQFLWTQAFADCIKARHPTLEMAVYRVREEEWESCAFHRKLAVRALANRCLGLDYMGNLVGLSENGRPFRLIETAHSTFLERIIEGTGVFNACF